MARQSVTPSFRLPLEHGAWGILIVPFVCAAGLAGRRNIPLLLAGACALSLFLLRGSLEAQGSPPHPRKVGWRIWLQPAHLILAAGSGTAAGLLVLHPTRQRVAV